MDKRIAKLRQDLDLLADDIRAFEAKVSTDAVRHQVGEDYAQWLNSLTADEALEHLKSVDDSRHRSAYVILSERLDPTALGVICLDYLRSPEPSRRLTGAIGIGSCLKQTHDKRASRELAKIICNQDEEKDIRWAAHASLILIQPEKHLELAATDTADADTSDLDVLLELDRKFIHSFL